jgi:antitoxin (DNA-binding transcriptional repressor) of toxin-antitoxin stability system
MSTTLAVEELQLSLAELLDQLQPGDEIILTRNQQPVAKLIGEQPKPQKRREPGLCKGMITIVADDEEHLNDFAEYMP